jgi:hypothetical protein
MTLFGKVFLVFLFILLAISLAIGASASITLLKDASSDYGKTCEFMDQADNVGYIYRCQYGNDTCYLVSGGISCIRNEQP